MRSSMLNRGEVLKYDDRRIFQVIFNDAMEAIGMVRNNDLLIVMADKTNHMIKVMVPSGKVGWVHFVAYRMLKLEHAGPVEV